MTTRRKRFVVLYQSTETLAALRRWADKRFELVAAHDLPTVTSAIHLYAQIDGVIAEQPTKGDGALKIMRLAAQRHAAAPRVMLIGDDVNGDVYAALHEGAITDLHFMPLEFNRLSAACRVEAPEAPAALPSRLRQPPLTGGMRANSSPSASR